MNKQTSNQAISALAATIMEHKRAYYSGKPNISDQDYDQLEQELKALDPTHPVLAFVGTDEVSQLEKVKHNTPMLSLQKTYDMEELLKWVEDHPVMAALKIDGNSVSLLYKNGSIHLAKTRGNGTEGENVTQKIMWCDTLPEKIDSLENIEIRGEMVCKGKPFQALCKEMKVLGLDAPTNPRNTVAGVLGRKQHIQLARHFEFIAFDLIMQNESQLTPKTEWDKQKILKSWGFELADPKVLTTAKDITSFLNDIEKQKSNLDYEIDGIVFSYNDLKLQASLGNTSHHPRYKNAFKWQGDTATSTIENIHWATSRLGIVTPVAVIQPVYLSGATITNVTLHNAANVMQLNLKAGDEIKIVRSGEVIPKLLEVIQSKSGEYELPNGCPECGFALHFDDVRMVCENTEQCPAQQSGQILNWIKVSGIEDLSDKRLGAMMESGLVKSIPDLYKLTKADLLTLPKTKEKLADKILKHISDSKKISLVDFLNGLGIAGTGKSSWQKICIQYPTLSLVTNLNETQLADIEGFAEKSATAVLEGLQIKASTIKELMDVGVSPRETPIPEASTQSLSGESFVLTGKLTKPREEIATHLISLGAKVASSTSSKTTAVVCEDPEGKSSKLQKARKLNVPIWSEGELYEYIESKS